MFTFLQICSLILNITCSGNSMSLSEKCGVKGSNNNNTVPNSSSTAQHMLMRSALDQITADSLSPEYSKAFLPNNGCSNDQSVDGNWQVVKDQVRNECIEKQNNQAAKAYELARKLKQPKENDCKIKISKQSMVCHARKVMDEVISDPYYTINMYGNVVEMIVDGKVVMMGIAETLTYDVEEESKEKPNYFKEPTASFKFNQLGGLLSQKGEIPSSKNSDPCSSCLENLNKKGNSTEGKPNSCNGCESLMDITNIQPNAFRITPNKDDSSDKKKMTASDSSKK